MIRMGVLAGLALMFLLMHIDGNLNKYINMKYAYLSVIAIVLLGVLFIFEFIRVYIQEDRKTKANAAKVEAVLAPVDAADAVKHEELQAAQMQAADQQEKLETTDEQNAQNAQDARSDELLGTAPAADVCGCVTHDHAHKHDHHDHVGRTKLSRALTYLILLFPIITGIFLPIQTLDSSFVKAKGFSFPQIDVTADNPGEHQFLKPDTSVYYGAEGYKEVAKQDLSEIQSLQKLQLNDQNYLKMLETIYNFPNMFVDKTISFNGFIYRGTQSDPDRAFVFRFGFIHCVADSGVFGMLVDFPDEAIPQLKDDVWVQVSGKMGLEFYQPFKQTIPVLKVDTWQTIQAPKDPYVYRS